MTRRRYLCGMFALQLLALEPNSSGAAEASPRSTSDILLVANQLQAQGQAEAALELLKSAHLADQGNEGIILALAEAYLSANNRTWAARVLSRYLDDNEKACNARLFLAWIQLQQGSTAQSRRLLEQAGCSSPPEILARRQLFIAYLELLENRRARAAEFIELARSSPAIFEEDQALLSHLTAAVQPEHVPMATGLVDFANGWTSNGLAGSPVDVATPKSSGTAITILDARLRMMTMTDGLLRPLIEGQLRAQQLWSEGTKELSFRTGTGRAGVLFGRGVPRILAVFAADSTQIQGGDRYSPGPLWFSEGQRGELELELPGSIFFMTGAGHRGFREVGRTRTEVDGTIGWATPEAHGLRLISGVSMRYHDARSDAFDSIGLTAVTQGRLTLPKDFEAGVTVSVSTDSFYRSEGAYLLPETSTRRDLRWRGTATLYSPPFNQLRLVARYEWTSRVSSAAAYEFADHRILAALEWRIDSDQLGQRIHPTTGRATVNYGALGHQGDSSSSQLRELMRQEETQRRSSTCLK